MVLKKSRCLLEQGLSMRKTAEALSRSPFGISREFRRNRYKNRSYAAHHGQKLYNKRKKKCGTSLLLENEIIRNYVPEPMELSWTPEQICERANLENQPFHISYPTIYRAVESGILPKQLKKIMGFKWKYKKHKSTENRGKTPDTISIENTNGLLRKFYPKGTSLASVTKEQRDHVVSLINNRPRKRLGWKTPAEVFNSITMKCCT